jgi:hypothetical protein
MRYTHALDEARDTTRIRRVRSVQGIVAGREAVRSRRLVYFWASASTFLQAGVSLSPALFRQAMIRPPPGTVPLQYFSKSPCRRPAAQLIQLILAFRGE